MFGDNPILSLLVHVVGPAAVATYLAVSFQRGGPPRLWRDAAILIVGIGAFALWKRSVVMYNRGPLNASGVDTWPWFPAVVGVSALIIQALGFRVIPIAVRIVAATLAGMVVVLAGTWIS